MFSSVVLVSLLLWTVGSSLTINDCPSNLPRDSFLTVFNDKCYYFNINTYKRFGDAQKKCQEMGGNLATVQTYKLNDFIWKELKNKYHRLKGYVWLGLSDIGTEGDFIWRDGSKMSYENFHKYTGSERPWFDISREKRNCVAMDVKSGEWLDMRCHEFLYLYNAAENEFVCEFSPESSTSSTPPIQYECPTSLPHNSYLQILDKTCYYFHFDNKLDFHDAQQKCSDKRGTLASIKSQKVQDFIENALKNTYFFQGEVWIGLGDDRREGHFVWRDGSYLNYENFGSGTRGGYSDFVEDCVAINAQTGKWYDGPCTSFLFFKRSKHYICEFHATPSTMQSVHNSLGGGAKATASTSNSNPKVNRPGRVVWKFRPNIHPASRPATAPPSPTQSNAFPPKVQVSAQAKKCPKCNFNCGSNQNINITSINGCIICSCI